MSPQIKARPTLYKGIRMRSRLEADYAAALDRMGYDWKYEPVCFGGEAGQWLPDFLIIKDGDKVFVEVKPVSLLDRQKGESEYDVIGRIDQILTRMSVTWLSEPDAHLHLTFWDYGAHGDILTIAAVSGQPWYTATRYIPSIWLGMGQDEKLSGMLGATAEGAV
jgi:hypothetical protein